MPVADLGEVSSHNRLPARYASSCCPVNVRDKKMTSIYELRNEVVINCKRVLRSSVRERSLIIELKRLLVEVPELADAFGTAPEGEL
jgi:hypothetical protein